MLCFFFKQKTAYEMRISDWSSDVCSSDLEHPPVGVVFWSFRIMVALGFAMLGIGLWSLVARARRSLYDWPWLHKAAVLMGPSGFIAVIAGWVTTEVGRQPWTVSGLRSAARRVGKECVSTCRSRWAP